MNELQNDAILTVDTLTQKEAEELLNSYCLKSCVDNYYSLPSQIKNALRRHVINDLINSPAGLDLFIGHFN